MFSYLKFPAPPGFTGAQRKKIKIIGAILGLFIPKANPDFDDKINDVKTWLVEFDTEDGIPQREVGLDAEEKAIVIMPFGKNIGYWVDNDLLLDDFPKHFKTEEINGPAFEEKWSSFRL